MESVSLPSAVCQIGAAVKSPVSILPPVKRSMRTRVCNFGATPSSSRTSETSRWLFHFSSGAALMRASEGPIMRSSSASSRPSLRRISPAR